MPPGSAKVPPGPAGRPPVLTTIGAGATTIESGTVTEALRVSVARATNDAVPAVVGVPVTVPFGFSVRPAGSAPLSRVQLIAPVPPVAASAAL